MSDLGPFTMTSIVQNLINKNNTTTSSYDISSGLKKRVQWVKIANVDYPFANTMYPVVCVSLNRSNSEFSQIGNTARREVEYSFQITPVTYYGMGQTDGGTDAMNEGYRIAGNLQRLIRAYPQLSATSFVLESDFTDTDYSSVRGDATYVQTAKMNLKVKVLTT